MEEIKKLENIECMHEDCENNATIRINTSQNEKLEYCPKHRRKFEEEIREKIKNKYEGMDKEEIAQKIIKDGEGLL